MAEVDSLAHPPALASEQPRLDASSAARTDLASRPLYDQIAAFDAFGQPSAKFEEEGLPYLVNEFWTSGQRRAHSLHEISYRACFKPQLPAFFIERLTRPGDWVYDPFMGRGTTLIEAALLGRKPAGNDVNPLSRLLTRPRLRPVSVDEAAKVLQSVDWRAGDVDDPDLLAFYSEKTLRELCALRAWLLARAPLEGTPDPAIDWVRMIALNRLTGHSPGFFSVYTLPPNQAASVQSQHKINAARKQVPPDRDIPKLILKKTRALLADGLPAAAPAFMLSTSAARRTPEIPDASISLVVTSPPFLDIVQYAEDNWLRCWFAGIDVGEVAIAQHRTEASWRAMVREALCELARVLRPGGHVAFEVGEVRKGRVLLERLVWEAAIGLPFERLFVMVNRQEFTKTANCWGVSNNERGTNTNRIVVLKRA
ncbi:MAG TPA: DNA methyltransferase [Methylocystis sp.]|nr:DNA methyltransferase [Methylocystis sp.]